MLKSIGGGVNLNMTQVVERQVRSLLTSFRNEIEKVAGQTGQLTGQMAGGIRQSALQIENLISVTKKLNADGSVMTTQKGYDTLNQSITEVYRNAQLVSRSLTTKGAMAEDIAYANKLYAEQIAYLKQLYNLKTQRIAPPDDTPTALRLDTQITKVDSQLTENRELIGLFDKQVVLRSKLVNLQAEEARLSRQFTDAAAMKGYTGAKEIEQAQQAYRKLSEAVRNYNAAAKSNNTAGRTYWSQNARDAALEIRSIQDKLGSLDLEEGTRKRLLDLIQKAKDAELQHANVLKDTGTGMSTLNNALDKMGGKLLQIAATYISLRALMSFWREASSFAQEYYDKLNEIQIVSGKTQQQANEMGAAYRKLAREMNVSATEIASAAVEFWRQGLPEAEVNQRLTATVQYAKISSMEFEKAAQLMTSATNTMDVSAQHVADAWAYLGDQSASGADEIGIAMSKASSSAQEFGLSFEWLGAYIATVSEKTRQAPEVVGTAINSIIARLHNIKEKGFNEEDATRINDVAKALASLQEPVKLLDEETGAWRDMSVIMQEIAAQWDTLSGKQRSYIATTLAGTRQQNTFLALMNDMAKGAEGGSRAFELYEGAMNSAGTAAQKYAIWQESVTAAQGKLAAAMQGLYSLVNAEWMKGAYSGLAGIVDLFVAGTEAVGGWNLKIPALIVGLGGLVAVILKVVSAVKAVKAAMAAGNILSALSGGTLGLIVTGIAGVVSLITMLAGSISKAFEPIDYSEQIGTLSNHQDSVRELAREYQALAAKEARTQEESNRMNTILETLAGSSLTLRDALTGATGGFVEQAEAVKALNSHLLETEARLNNLKREQAVSAFKDLGALREAQGNAAYSRNAEHAWQEYDAWSQTHDPSKGGFYQHATQQSISWGNEKEVREYWKGIVQVLDGMEREIGTWIGVRTKDIEQWFANLGLSAQASTKNAAAALDDAWQVYIGHLQAFAEGPQYEQMGSYFQSQMARFFQAVVDGIAREADVTEAALTGYATRIKAKQEELYALFAEDDALAGLLTQQEAMLPNLTLENLDAYNVIVGQINAILEARNALAAEDIDKLDLLPIITPEELARLREANAEYAVLSGALAELFEKYRKSTEAKVAEKALYADQIKALKDAWVSDETGAAFIKALNEMYAANDELASGMAETHLELAKLASGELDYAEGLDALTKMERLATTRAQERTAELVKEAEAAKTLEEAQKEHYASLLDQMRDAYESAGYDAFVKLWDDLSDKAKQDMIGLYPEIAKLATAMGETADGAQVFADALAKAADMKFTQYGESFGKDSVSQSKKESATTAKEAGFKDQLQALSTALQSGGADGVRRALFEIYDANETLYQSLMETYTVFYRLGQADLNTAQAADILSDAYLAQAQSSAKAAQALREQIALEKELEAASKNYYRDTLEKLQEAYRADGSKGFHALWEMLDDSARKYILATYGGIADLAAEAVDRGTDVVDGIFEQAIADAVAMRETLLRETLAEDAGKYMAKLPADEAKKTGFQDQLSQLRDSLASGDFMNTLASFGEEMANALLSEHAWLNEIIDTLAKAEEGTFSLTEATLLMDEHIQGTQEHFLASVEALIEANSKALDTEEEQIAMLETLLALLERDGGITAFAEAFSKLDAEMQKAVYDKSPALKRFFENIQVGADDIGEAVRDMAREVNRLKLDKLAKEGKVFDGLADAMDDAAKGGKAFAKSYGTVLSDVEALSEAMGALAFVQGDGKKKADDLTDAYNVLANYTGVSADMLRSNLDPALWAIASDMDMASYSAEYLTNWLFNAAGVQFSAANWQAQLAALAASSDETVAHVAQLVSTMLQAAGSSLYLDGNTVKVRWGSKGSYTPPSARKSGGGGGGGSSRETERTLSAIERLLDLMRQLVAIQDHRRELMQLAQDYHEVRGEVQGVIAYMEKEQQIIRENSASLEGYVRQLEQEMAVKQREVASMSTSAKEYEQAANELDDLQKTHQDYSKQLIQNKTDIERLNQAIKSQRDAIRQMEIDLRELVHDAILDREERTRRMLQGTIDLENEIIDILTQRYEKERDELIRLADLKRKALEEEMRLLDEQLAKRKALEDQEDKLKKLAELEAQLARISMDPTRRKEELALREEIAKLRKEIAWGMAEDEVDAQKGALQKQIDSVEEYLTYIEEYYEELLSNPRRLVEEMSYLLQQTDEEILAWLTANHVEYETATDATRQNMVIGWQEMLDDMRGYTQTYWDEVEAIIAQGEDAIIAFLMEHSENYRTAGRLQAEAYVDQWRQQLENLRNAYKQVAADIQSYNYSVIQPSTYTGGSGSGSSGSSGTSNPRFVISGTGYAEAYKATATTIDHAGYTFVKDPHSDYWYKQSEAKIIDGGRTYYWPTGTTRYIKKYALGGLADFTGPAWLDGSKTKPERILSPYQTELFEDLITSLHNIRIKTPTMPLMPQTPAAADRLFHIENIQIRVEKLENDADYEAMAHKVGEFLYSEMTRGTAVGGFRLGR